MASRPKIIILDGHTLNPGDLDWAPLREIGEIEVYPRSFREEVQKRSLDAEILVVNKVSLGKEEIEQMPHLKYIVVTATGYNNLDLDVLAKSGIKASNIPDYGSFGIAQHAMALLLEITNNTYRHYQDVLENKWLESRDFSYTNSPIIELANKSIGLVGLGKIGYKMGVMAEAMGMYVSYFSRESREISWEYYDQIENLLSTADIVSLHLPLTPETHELINWNTIRKMKKGAILINTSRGHLVNEKDLSEALNEGYLGGAGLDVLTEEPPPEDHVLFKARNCIITPHNAWASRESRSRILEITKECIQSFLNGAPINLIT